MIDFNQAISIIRRNGGFKPNRKDTSYYRTYTIEGNRPLQARVSNHGTWLWTWYDKDYDPSYAINFCVVFSENGEYDSDVSVDMDIKDEEGNIIGQKKPFEVIQYVYNCQLLDINDATLINQQVQSIWRNKGFNDPFANTPKHAKVLKLKPNEPIEQIVENKQYNSNTNMNKKLIRLTESDLHRIIKESVNNILNELHPITYSNYANKRYAQSKIDKAEKGRDAAVKAFNDRYGYEVKDDEGKPFSSVKMQKNYDNKGYNVQSTHPINKDKYYDTSDRYQDRLTKIANASDNMKTRYGIANQMHNGNGDFEYEKGKGYRYKGFDDEDYKKDDSLYLK